MPPGKVAAVLSRVDTYCDHVVSHGDLSRLEAQGFPGLARDPVLAPSECVRLRRTRPRHRAGAAPLLEGRAAAHPCWAAPRRLDRCRGRAALSVFRCSAWAAVAGGPVRPPPLDARRGSTCPAAGRTGFRRDGPRRP